VERWDYDLADDRFECTHAQELPLDALRDELGALGELLAEGEPAEKEARESLAAAAAFGDDLEPVLALDDFLLVGVNTTRARRHKDGEVSPAQVARVEGLLRRAAPGQLRVVVTHQPACVMRPEDEKDRLHGGEAALQAWSAAGADLVLGGHIHLPYVSDLCARAPSAPRPTYCVQAGTAVSHRVRHGTPNSVNLIRWEGASPATRRVCRVERWDYDLADDRFECTHAQELPLDAL
jgi:3',5'-cyclic AMP phosphodiesterase CpdA